MKDTYQVKSVVMDDVEIERSLTRIAHRPGGEPRRAGYRACGNRHPGDLLAKRLVERSSRSKERSAPGQPGHQLLPR
ncbi:MAG: hypothetical protein ACLTQI_00125 [Slackia sp.]